MLSAIVETIAMLNGSYGYGEVLGVIMSKDWKTGTVTILRTSCQPETRSFRFDCSTKTVFFARHQRKISQC